MNPTPTHTEELHNFISGNMHGFETALRVAMENAYALGKKHGAKPKVFTETVFRPTPMNFRQLQELFKDDEDGLKQFMECFLEEYRTWKEEESEEEESECILCPHSPEPKRKAPVCPPAPRKKTRFELTREMKAIQGRVHVQVESALPYAEGELKAFLRSQGDVVKYMDPGTATPADVMAAERIYKRICEALYGKKE